MKWKKGRQKTKYFVKTFLSFWFFDLHLIKVPENGWVPWHTDPVQKGKKHLRINLHFGKYKGGNFLCEKKIFSLFRNKFVCFRPDITPHKLSKVKSGTQYILSLGFLI